MFTQAIKVNGNEFTVSWGPILNEVTITEGDGACYTIDGLDGRVAAVVRTPSGFLVLSSKNDGYDEWYSTITAYKLIGGVFTEDQSAVVKIGAHRDHVAAYLLVPKDDGEVLICVGFNGGGLFGFDISTGRTSYSLSKDAIKCTACTELKQSSTAGRFISSNNLDGTECEWNAADLSPA